MPVSVGGAFSRVAAYTTRTREGRLTCGRSGPECKLVKHASTAIATDAYPQARRITTTVFAHGARAGNTRLKHDALDQRCVVIVWRVHASTQRVTLEVSDSAAVHDLARLSRMGVSGV